MKTMIVLTALFGSLSMHYAQDDAKSKGNNNKSSGAKKAVESQTVILPDGTATVVTQPASEKQDIKQTSQRRRAGKMEAVEIKEVKSNEPKK